MKEKKTMGPVYETNKSKIKNGMTFRYNNDFYYKFGKDCIRLNYPFCAISFECVFPEEIKIIYKVNGEPLLNEDKIYETSKSKIKSGMIFKQINNYCLRVGDKYMYIDLFKKEKTISFERVRELDISMIFNCKGVAILKEENETKKEE